MNEALFMEEIDQWLADVRGSALELYSSGCASEHILGIATAIVNSRAVTRATKRREFSAGVPRRLPAS